MAISFGTRLGRLGTVLLLVVVGGCAREGPTDPAAPTSSGTPAATSGSSATSADPSAATPRPTPPPTDPPYITARRRLGSQPCGILAAQGAIWVSLYGESALLRLDPTTLTVTGRTPTGSQPCGLAFGAGSLWVENYGGNTVTRVDVTTGAVQATIPVGASPFDVTFADGAAWVTDYGDGTVSRIDAATNARLVIPVGPLPIGVTPTRGAVWATTSDGYAVRISTATRQVVARVRVGTEAGWTASTTDMLWVAAGSAGEVARIDPATNTVVGRFVLDAKALDGDVVAGTPWFPTKSGALFPIDARTDVVGAKLFPVTGNPFVIAGDAGIIWAVDYAGTDVVRIDPTRR